MLTRLLLIDDNPGYCAQLVREASEYGFEMVFFHNLEQGLRELIASRRIKAIVLDGRCYLDPEQTSAARSNFVILAINRIRDVEVVFNRILPFCINTEHPADFAEDLDGTAPVFCKGDQHNELFRWIKAEIAKLPETIVLKQYYDLFEVFENRFTDEETDLLIDVLQAKNSSDSALIITSLAILRRLLEKMMDVACIEILGRQPESINWTEIEKQPAGYRVKPLRKTIHKPHMSRTRMIINNLHPGFMPAELYQIAGELYKICSKYGNHNEPVSKNTVRFIPGKYTLKRLVFGFAEIAVNIFEHNKKR
jgi:hypothetical protein